MLAANGIPATRQELARADKAREIVNKSIREVSNWTGRRPTLVRVKPSYYLILVQVGWIDSWPGVEVKPG